MPLDPVFATPALAKASLADTILSFGLDPLSTITGSLPNCALPGLSGGVFELANKP